MGEFSAEEIDRFRDNADTSVLDPLFERYQVRMEAGMPATHADGSLCVLRRHHARTTIVNKDATTYAKFAADGSPDGSPDGAGARLRLHRADPGGRGGCDGEWGTEEPGVVGQGAD